MELSNLERQWYYTVEIEPGVYTSGHDHPSISLTRALLRRVYLKGASCLDIGTQEALIPVLLKRAQAKHVVAYDRWKQTAKVSLVRQAYDVSFDYICGMPLEELPRVLSNKKNNLFDVVVFSGVLYHLINPLGLLSIARSFVRDNGIFLIETAVLQSEEMTLHFNAGGKLYGQSANYFIPTTNCLDYFLRMLCLDFIEVRYLGKVEDGVFRVGILCRATREPTGREAGDEWIFSDRFPRDLENEYGIALGGSSDDLPEVEVSRPSSSVLSKAGLYAAIDALDAYEYAPEELILKLDSQL